MKYKILFTVLCLLFTGRYVQAHDYHASITDVTFNSRTQSLEVAVKVFTDDLESALSKRSKSKVTYSSSEQVHKLLSNYLQTVLQFEVEKGKPLPQKFLGSEEDTDVVWLYVEIPVQTAVLPQLFIKNAVLTELFTDQMNVVNVTYKGKVNSALFQKSDGIKKMVL
ncbi:DUF6702 family protein [Pontibacter sp. SGAir0037]|uniref:DUF6702 family protein n=1 Tax=Pontibacter sp. SGAir0037 TaxID=2571030 RepID=UPI0010CD4356|nr:DUF6702 family protein [Pontibacter sp. SGAir0037]QCR20905.1 hypothetical protein C1N53_00045 [Pontibacter sp. SGAir0037]